MNSQKFEEMIDRYENLWKQQQLILHSSLEEWRKSELTSEINNYFTAIKELECDEQTILLNLLKQALKRSINAEKSSTLFRSNTAFKNEENLSEWKRLMNIQYAIRTMLINGVKELEFDIRKQENQCNCELKQELEFRLWEKPENRISFLDFFSDGYFDYELYQCEECNIYWVNDLFSDDGPSKGWRRLENEDIKSLKYSSWYVKKIVMLKFKLFINNLLAQWNLKK